MTILNNSTHQHSQLTAIDDALKQVEAASYHAISQIEWSCGSASDFLGRIQKIARELKEMRCQVQEEYQALPPPTEKEKQIHSEAIEHAI